MTNALPPYPGHLRVSVELVTPELAEKYMADMHDNRSLATHNLRKLTRKLELDLWFPDISVVYFDGEGRAWDGQHRFQAITDTGKAAFMIFVRGVRPEAATSIDHGRSRSSSDALRMMGEDRLRTMNTVRAAIMDALARYDVCGGYRALQHGVVLAHEEIFPYLDDPYLEKAVAISQWFGGKPFYVSSKASGFAVVQTFRLDEDLAAKFWDRLRSGENMEAGNPLLTWRNRMQSNPVRGAGSRNVQLSVYALNRTWNAWVTAEALYKFQFPGDFGWEKIPALRLPDAAYRQILLDW